MSKRRTRQLGIALAAVLGAGSALTVGTAIAQPSRHRDHDLYERNRTRLDLYDRDRDGRLDASEREVMDHDTDGDGRLSRRERASLEIRFWNLDDDSRFYVDDGRSELSFRFELSARQFARFDTNRDGALSWRELRHSRLGRRFSWVDRDGDRLISPRELDRYHRRMQRRVHARYNPGVIRGEDFRYEYRLDNV
jgi:Ca2+-binding EF-hand superfamily protein